MKNWISIFVGMTKNTTKTLMLFVVFVFWQWTRALGGREKIVFCRGGFGYNGFAVLLPPERVRRARM